MARTFRRKGGEPSWLTKDEEWLWEYWKRTPKQQIAHYHSDGWMVGPTSKKWIQKVWAKRRRQWDRQEFAKYHKEAEYDPIWFQTQIDTWWWD